MQMTEIRSRKWVIIEEIRLGMGDNRRNMFGDTSVAQLSIYVASGSKLSLLGDMGKQYQILKYVCMQHTC